MRSFDMLIGGPVRRWWRRAFASELVPAVLRGAHTSHEARVLVLPMAVDQACRKAD